MLSQESVPLYKTLEKKVETLNEFVQVNNEMIAAVQASDGGNGNIMLPHSDLCTTLLRIREEFETKHRHWGCIILSDAE